MSKQYGNPIHDFRDESSYPDPTKLSGPLLAWELIRRNPEYQQDYEVWKKNTSHETELKLFSKWFGGSHIWFEKSNDVFLLMFDPKEDKPYLFDLFFKHAPYAFDCRGGKPSPYPDYYLVSRLMRKTDYGAFFDLTMPLHPQIKMIKEFLQRKQKEKNIKPSRSIPNRSIHKVYWRIIDAKSSDAKPKEIRKVLKLIKNDDHDQFKECLKQALKWRNSDFRKLASLI
ncbi:MAG: hypothetical protein IH886_14925 [Nitrospinae bacterium]|nr:hypothetical protein [Nitrospinota bacterium]